MSLQFCSLTVSKSAHVEHEREDYLVLRFLHDSRNQAMYHHVKVPSFSTVHVLFQSKQTKDLLRIRFELPTHQLFIHAFKRMTDATYRQVPLDELPHLSSELQSILRSIHFFGWNQVSFIVDEKYRKLEKS